MTTICEPFARVLAAGRGQFNQRVVEARRRYPTFDPAAFAAFLQSAVDPVVQAVAEVAPQRVVPVTLAAYDLALDLCGQGLAGPQARSQNVGQVWQRVAPAYAHLVGEQPVDVLGALTNAIVYLERFDSTRPQQWIAEMAALAPQIATLDALRSAGQLVAWRAGVAHFRNGALAAADALPEDLALAAAGVTGFGQWRHVSIRLANDPWWRPYAGSESADYPPMEVGQFAGFGGAFAVPPEVRPSGEGFVVRSDERYFFLVADAYGAILHSASAEEFEQAGSAPAGAQIRLQASTAVINNRRLDLPLPADGLRVTWNTHTVAITSPYSHAITLVALV